MHRHRCLLIACVTLSHACDSKDRSQSPSAPAPKDVKALELSLDHEAPSERMFEGLTKAARTWNVKLKPGKHVLPVDVKVE